MVWLDFQNKILIDKPAAYDLSAHVEAVVGALRISFIIDENIDTVGYRGLVISVDVARRIQNM